MLTISGSTQCISATAEYKKGATHLFTLFSTSENLDDQLKDIESFMINLGWDEIVIEESVQIENADALEHNILQQAFEKAIDEGLSLVINNVPVSAAA